MAASLQTSTGKILGVHTTTNSPMRAALQSPAATTGISTVHYTTITTDKATSSAPWSGIQATESASHWEAMVRMSSPSSVGETIVSLEYSWIGRFRQTFEATTD